MIQPIVFRSFNNDMFFSYKLLNNLTNSPDLLAKIIPSISNHTLYSTNSIYVQPCKKAYGHYAFLDRVLLNVNISLMTLTFILIHQTS